MWVCGCAGGETVCSDVVYLYAGPCVRAGMWNVYSVRVGACDWVLRYRAAVLSYIIRRWSARGEEGQLLSSLSLGSVSGLPGDSTNAGVVLYLELRCGKSSAFTNRSIAELWIERGELHNCTSRLTVILKVCLPSCSFMYVLVLEPIHFADNTTDTPRRTVYTIMGNGTV